MLNTLNRNGTQADYRVHGVKFGNNAKAESHKTAFILGLPSQVYIYFVLFHFHPANNVFTLISDIIIKFQQLRTNGYKNVAWLSRSYGYL